MIANQLKNLIIGLFVIIACFLIVAIILYVKPSVGDGKQVVFVKFSNINGLNIGTKVTYAGKPIGEVECILQVADARKKALGHFGEVYPYVLKLRLDSSFTIYTTDKVLVQTAGLLGEKYVAIVPEPFKPGQVAKIVTPDDVLHGDSGDIIENAMNQIASISEKFEETLDRLLLWVDKYGDHLGSLVESLDFAVKELGKTIKTVNDLHLVEDVKSATKNITAVFGQIDQVLYQMREDAFFANISGIAKNLNHTTQTIAEGKGTLGRIIEEDGLYLQVNALLSKTNNLVNDINQYGLLFQYNKQWQRNRARMIAESARARNPQSMQAYIDGQMGQINMTIAYMKELTEKFNGCDLVTNQEFRKNFTHLMMQINSLQEKIKLYNEEMNEIRYRNNCGCQ